MSENPLILRDDDIERRLTATDAVAAVRRFLEQAAGTASPPRQRIALADQDLVLSAGALPAGRRWGFRAYGSAGETDQVTAVWDAAGRLVTVVIGTVLGEMRTGAIGAVAVDLLARPGPIRLAVLGSGRQAYRQVWAVQAVRPLTEVAVFSPTPAHRDAFARTLRERLSVPARAVDEPGPAVRRADVTVLATNGLRVIEPDWLAPGSQVSTLGPKSAAGSELPASAAGCGALLVTDSPSQLASYPGGYFLPAERFTALAELVVAGRNRWQPDRIAVFGSVGLTGTEVALADRAASGPVG